MPQKIQRVPRGLNELLSLAGGLTPQLLADQVQPTLEILQFYGLQQLNVESATDGALTEGPVVTVTLSTRFWTVLFGAQFNVLKTATMTALTGNIILHRAGMPLPRVVVSQALGPFGATETGNVSVCWTPPYPIICAPGTLIQGQMPILGTDANASVSIRAEFGVLG